MARIPELPLEQMSPEQRKVHDALVNGPRGRAEGPLKVWLHSAELAAKAQDLGVFCRYNTRLPQRLSELAIIVMGAHWKAGFEWHVHAPIALKAGIDPAAVEAIRTGERPALTRTDEIAVYEFTRELLEKKKIGEATYRQAEALFGHAGLIELVGILGYYSLISLTIVAFEVPVPPGSQEPFADQ